MPELQREPLAPVEGVTKAALAGPAAETRLLTETLLALDDTFYGSIERAVRRLRETFARGGKVLVCGNGGSAAEAQHFSDELVGRYRKSRRSYPVIALTADGATLTCIGNDFGFEEVFARQVEAYGKPGDVLLALSTSGESANVLRAVEQAKRGQLFVIALTAPQGRLRELADLTVSAPSLETARVQEIHLHVIHLLSEAFEPGNRWYVEDHGNS